MIRADMPAPLVRVTASILVPSASAPKDPRVAVAAFALVMNKAVHSVRQAAPRITVFMITPIFLEPNIPAKKASFKCARLKRCYKAA